MASGQCAMLLAGVLLESFCWFVCLFEWTLSRRKKESVKRDFARAAVEGNVPFQVNPKDAQTGKNTVFKPDILSCEKTS